MKFFLYPKRTPESVMHLGKKTSEEQEQEFNAITTGLYDQVAQKGFVGQALYLVELYDEDGNIALVDVLTTLNAIGQTPDGICTLVTGVGVVYVMEDE